MSSVLLNPLVWNVPIVDANGLPTPDFMRKWVQQQAINKTITVFNVSGSGFLVQTGPTTWALRSIAAGTGITVTNGNGVSGNPTVSLTNTAVTPGSYGDASHIATFTVNAQGQLTAAASVAIPPNNSGWLPLVDGSDPPNLITDGAGVLITAAYAP